MTGLLEDLQKLIQSDCPLGESAFNDLGTKIVVYLLLL